MCVSLPRRFVTPLFAVAAVCAVVLTSGCLDMESGVAFNKDLTGKATSKMAIDLEPFMRGMVQMQNKAQGKADAPTDQELATMGAMMMSQFGEGIIDAAAVKNNLPQGVTLLDASQKADGLKLTMNFTFGFTDATKLPLIELPPNPKLGAAAGAGARSPLKPFESLEITDEGTTILIASKPKEKPAAAAPDATKAKADAQTAINTSKSQLDQLGMGDMLKNMKMRLAFRFDVPFTVIEHTAPVKEGTAYIWEMKIDSLDSLDKLPDPPSMKLRFNKK